MGKFHFQDLLSHLPRANELTTVQRLENLDSPSYIAATSIGPKFVLISPAGQQNTLYLGTMQN